MRLSASGKGFHRVYLSEAQEVFLDGHVRAFEHFGGVPDRMIRYDNLKPAVVQVLKGRGRRSLIASSPSAPTTASTASSACRASRVRTRKVASKERSGASAVARLVPVPVSGLDGRAERAVLRRAMQLTTGATSSADRLSVGEHFAIESLVLRPLPAEAFDTPTRLNCSVDKKSRVCVRQARYSVPVRLAGRRLDVLLGAETVEAYEGPRRRRYPRAGAERCRGAHPRPLPRGLPVKARCAARCHCTSPGTAPVRCVHADPRRVSSPKLAGASATRKGPGPWSRSSFSHRSLPAEAVIAGMARALKVGRGRPGGRRRRGAAIDGGSRSRRSRVARWPLVPLRPTRTEPSRTTTISWRRST